MFRAESEDQPHGFDLLKVPETKVCLTMAMGRAFKVYHNLTPQGQVGPGPSGEEQHFSLVVEQRGKSEVLLMECINDNYVMATMGEMNILSCEKKIQVP